MWWSSRRAALFALLALPACGFRPLYGPEGGARGLIGSIALDPVPGRLGFLFRQSFEAEAGVARTPRYRLAVTIEIEEESRAIAQDAAITRFNLTALGRFALTPVGTAEPVFDGQARAFTAYNATAAPFPTRVAKRDAERRITEELARRILSGISVAAVAGRL